MNMDMSGLHGPIVTNGGGVRSRLFDAPKGCPTQTRDSRGAETKIGRDKSLLSREEPQTGRGWGELMGAAQGGEAASYRRLLDLLQPWLEQYFLRRLPMAMVEDAVQDTLIAIHKKRHTYDAARPFEHWLDAIAGYKCIDRLQTMEQPRFDGPDEDEAA